MNVAQPSLTPDARAFGADVAAVPFCLGEVDGKWRLREIVWPKALIDVTASVGTFSLRFDLSGFPAQPPTAQLWDLVANCPLPFHRWPRGKGGRVSDVFRSDWQQGTALYLACDRVTIMTHPNWATQMPARLWRTNGSIVQYLEEVYVLLNSEDYSPPLVAAA